MSAPTEELTTMEIAPKEGDTPKEQVKISVDVDASDTPVKPRPDGSLRLSRNASVNASLTQSLKNWNMNVTEEGVAAPDDGAEPKSQPHHLGCGILGRYPVISILVFAAAGIATGVGLSAWQPETEADAESKDTALQWIGLIGDLFIRALKTVVLPLVFVNMVMSVVDMMSVGKASAIGGKVVIFYLVTTGCASLFGILAAWAFSPLFSENTDDMALPPPMVTLGCNSAGSFLSEGTDGSVSCSSSFASESDIQFEITDVNGRFSEAGSSGPKDDLSLSDSMYQGVFMKLVTDNIFGSFVEGNFAAVVFFAIIFGIALAKEMMMTTDVDDLFDKTLGLFREIDRILTRMINWIIMVTPFAVFSLIAAAVGGQDNLARDFANVAYLILSIMVGMIAQFLFVYVGGFGLLTRSNPFSYLKHIVPAQTMAFACASSAATLPVTMECVQDTGRVPEPIWRFILPLGATINMDGTAIYIPCACVWMAILNGITPNAGNYVLLVILATVGSAGAAPVPASGLVLILTSYNTVFNTTGTPMGFSFVIAIDWFIDRLCTMMNITSDTVVCGSVAATTNFDDVIFDKKEAIDDTNMTSKSLKEQV